MDMEVFGMLMKPIFGLSLIIGGTWLTVWLALLPWKILQELRCQGAERREAHLQIVTLLVKILQALGEK